MFELYKGKIRLVDSKIPEQLRDLRSMKRGDDIIKYIWLSNNRTNDNPLKDLDEAYRSKEAEKIAFGENFKWNIYSDEDIAKIKKSAMKYLKAQSTGLQKEIDLYDKKIYQFIDLLRSTEPEIIKNIHEITGKVSFTTNIDIINSVLENVIDIVSNKLKLKEMKKTGRYTSTLRPTKSGSSAVEKILNKMPI